MNRLYAKTRRLPPRGRSPKLPGASWKAVSLFGVVTVISLFGYIAEVSTTATKSDSIRHLDHEISMLKDQGEHDEFQVASGGSIQAIEEKVKALGMVPTDHVDYLMQTNPVVAKR